MGASSYCFEKFDRILLSTNFLNNLIMKKKNLKSLSLNKKSISNFDQSKEIIGGVKSMPIQNCQHIPTGSDTTGLGTLVDCVTYSVTWCHSNQC